MKKIRLSQTQLKNMVKKVLNENHHKSYMAKSQLYNIAKKSQSMFDRLEKGEPLEDWMESKIAQMSNMMNSVSDSFNYDEHHEKDCPDGMYWCEKDGICKPDSQKMDQLITTVEMNEAIATEALSIILLITISAASLFIFALSDAISAIFQAN